jgi:cystathionine beta-synthase/cysteine synthase A
MSDEIDDTLTDVPDHMGCMELAEYLQNDRCEDTFLTLEDRDSPFEMVSEDPILREIGNTPLVPHPENEQLVLKMEKKNPTASHKDRLGAGMILAMREKGELEEGQRVVEASSGNQAGGVALAANRLGHPCTIVMRDNASPIKIGYVKALGADIVTVPPVGHEDDEYYQHVAKDYADEHDAVLINQYERALNRHVHNEWTGPELWKQIEGEGVTHIVAAMGSGGTLSGVSQYISNQTEAIEFIGVDGNDSAIHRVFEDEDPGDYNVDIEGLGQWRVTDSTDFTYIDDVRTVSDSMARSRARHEAEDNGVLVGPSSGAVMEIAHDITKEDDSANVVAFVHDGAEQYFHEVDGW